MLNVHDLERRWLKYKIKTFTPYIITSFIIVIGLISTLVYYPFSSSSNTTVVEEVIIASSPIESNNVEVNSFEPTAKTQVNTLEIDVPQNTKYNKESNTLILKPSLHFMDNIEEGIDPYLSDVSEEPLYNERKPSYTNNASEVSTTTPVNVQKPSKKKKGLTIVSQKNESDLKDVIRRFKNNKNPALSLFVAKRYYELKQYQKSYNYALMTNEINKEIDESWIIFSKSLVKLGQHELAIVTLKSYLKVNKSSQAEILLRKIEAGSFR